MIVGKSVLISSASQFVFSEEWCLSCFSVAFVCRCIAVYKPFVLRRFGVKSSLLAIAIVVVFSLLLHIWCYQVSEALPRPSGFSKICMPDFTSDNGYTAFVFYIVLSAIVPSVLVASISSAITVQVWRSFSERRSLQNIDILLQSSGKSDQSDSPARRTWSKLARGVNGMKEDVAQSREVRSSLTFVLCALLHTLFYICSAVFWLLYTAQVRRTEAGRADAPSWLAVLCEVSVAMCAVPHCLKSSVILRRTSRARACYDTSVAVRSSHYSCAWQTNRFASVFPRSTQLALIDVGHLQWIAFQTRFIGNLAAYCYSLCRLIAVTALLYCLPTFEIREISIGFFQLSRSLPTAICWIFNQLIDFRHYAFVFSGQFCKFT